MMMPSAAPALKPVKKPKHHLRDIFAHEEHRFEMPESRSQERRGYVSHIMPEFKPVIYQSIAEKREAFMRAVNMRKEWEAKMRQKIAEMDANKAAYIRD